MQKKKANTRIWHETITGKIVRIHWQILTNKKHKIKLINYFLSCFFCLIFSFSSLLLVLYSSRGPILSRIALNSLTISDDNSLTTYSNAFNLRVCFVFNIDKIWVKYSDVYNYFVVFRLIQLIICFLVDYLHLILVVNDHIMVLMLIY